MAGRLLVVSGLPATGKTAVAHLLAGRLGAVHLSIDVVEEAILACGLPPGWQVGVAAYEVVGATAAMNLDLGAAVVVDAVNDSQAARDTWHRAVADADAALCWVQLVCSDPEEHRQRLARRERDLTHVGEPTWQQVADRADAYEPWREACRMIETAGRSIDDVADDVASAWAERGRVGHWQDS